MLRNTHEDSDVDLLVVFAMAIFVLFGSPDTAAYEAHRDQFFWVAFVGTLVYFVTAYWELRRRKAVAEKTIAEHLERTEQPA